MKLATYLVSCLTNSLIWILIVIIFGNLVFSKILHLGDSEGTAYKILFTYFGLFVITPFTAIIFTIFAMKFLLDKTSLSDAAAILMTAGIFTIICILFNAFV